MTTTPIHAGPSNVAAIGSTLDDQALRGVVATYLDAWPSAGLAAAVVRHGRLEWFLGHGVADIDSRTAVSADTVFRIASITKTFTAIAVMQLWEQGLIDLDAPVSRYLRTLRLISGKPGFQPVTVRHLLTHTGGIGYWRRLSDVLHPGVGSGDLGGRTTEPLADYYRPGLLVEVEPGTKWVYTNHGFAVLGQVVEDVNGEPIDRYLREHVFEPLGMCDTDLVPSGRMRAHLATGYVLRSHGLKAVANRPVPTVAAGGAYSTVTDLAQYVAALMHGGGNKQGSVIRPDTLATMFQPHFRADPRIVGMGLGFHLDDADGHRTVGHSGILSGFLSAMLVAPDDGIGVIALRNTGGLDARGMPEPLVGDLLRRVLDLPARTPIPPRPDTWSRLCGWYGPPRGPLTNLFVRAVWGAGTEIAVRDRQLMLLPLTPMPAMRNGLRLLPDDPDDPWVFRADSSALGYPSPRVVFAGAEGADAPASRLAIDSTVFQRRPDIRNPRRLMRGALAASAATLAIRRRHRPAARK